MVPAVSVEPTNVPGYSLRHHNYDFAWVRDDGSATFAADASAVSFRPVA